MAPASRRRVFVLIAVAMTAACRAGAQTPTEPADGKERIQVAVPLSPDTAKPVGGKHVKAIHLLPITGALSGGVEASVAAPEGLYLAGKRWNRRDGQGLWLWHVDSAGVKKWDKMLPLEKSNSLEVVIIGLLPGGSKFSSRAHEQGVRVVYREGLTTKLSFFKSDGTVVLEKTIGELEETRGLISAGDDNVYLFGDTMRVRNERQRGWVANTTRLGAVRWKRVYNASPEWTGVPLAADGQPAEQKGLHHTTMLTDGVMRADGTLVVAGVTGSYSKFGQGPSQLWLLHVDSEGGKLSERFLPDGRLMGFNQRLAAAGDDVLVAYTKAQLPPIATAPKRELEAAGSRLARFDAGLTPLWEKPAVNTFFPGATALVGPAPFVTISTFTEKLTIRAVDDGGEELWTTNIDAPGGWVTPQAALRTPGGLATVWNYRVSGRNDEEIQVLVAFVAPPTAATLPAR